MMFDHANERPQRRRIIKLALLLFIIALLIPEATAAQVAESERVYDKAEVSSVPILAAPSEAWQRVLAAYPADFRREGISGSVLLSFIVRSNGRVDWHSIEIIEASNDRFGDAAKEAMAGVRFVPGEVNRNPVHTRIEFPVNFRAALK